jgi:hypothetical protein
VVREPGAFTRPFFLIKNMSFIRVNEHEISKALELYDTDTHVRAAAGTVLNAALGGGVAFQRSDGNELDPMRGAWLKQVWTKWIRAVYRQIWSVGFAACTTVTHTRYGDEPRVLVLEMVRVEFKTSVDGTIEWSFTDRRTGRHIEKVTVFVQDAPATDGGLRSRITSLMPDLDFENELRVYTIEGARWRAKPTVFLEPSKTTSMDMEPRLLASDIFLSSLKSQPSKKSQEWQHQHPSAAVPVAGIPYAQYEETTPAQFLLPVDHKMVSAPTGGPCYANLNDCKEHTFKRVLTAWAIPPSMLLDTRGGGGRATAGNHNITFQQSQSATKCFAIGAVKTMLHEIDKRRVRKDRKRKRPHFDQMGDIVPTLPSIPQSIVMEALYKDGILTYEQYIKHLTHTHSLPLEAFYEIPLIPVAPI